MTTETTGDAWTIPTGPCDCGADLPLDLLGAGYTLYGGAPLDPKRLVALIAASLRERDNGLEDNDIGTMSVWAWLGTQPEWLVAAVRHQESGACERARAERDERHAQMLERLGLDASTDAAATFETTGAAPAAEEAAWAALAPPVLTPEQERLVEELVIAVEARYQRERSELVERLATLLPGVGPAIRELAEPALTG